MSDTVNFAELANTKVGDVAPPPRIPDGHYSAIITGPMKEHKAKSGNAAMRFPVKLIAPMSDVDAEALAEAGGVPDKSYNLDFWMSVDARFIFTNFGKAMGHSEDLNLIELAEAVATSGDEFVANIKSDPSPNDPERFFTNIQGVVAMSDYSDNA